MIINLYRLELPEPDLNKLIEGAKLHHKRSNISFKITSATDKEVTVRVVQGYHLSGNYADAKTLRDRTKELFGSFVGDRALHAHAVTYQEFIKKLEKGGTER